MPKQIEVTALEISFTFNGEMYLYELEAHAEDGVLYQNDPDDDGQPSFASIESLLNPTHPATDVLDAIEPVLAAIEKESA